ncbi:MAG: flagellar biosynthesis regulator FlaF [Pseudomonadota bacterium]
MAHALAAEAYGALTPNLTSPTRAEALVFADVTRRLESIFSDPQASHASKIAVLHDNRRLWLAAAAASADDGNALPEGLRVGLLNLAAFVDRQTSALLRGEGSVTVLSEINRRVIGGLSAGAT